MAALFKDSLTLTSKVVGQIVDLIKVLKLFFYLNSTLHFWV